MSDGSDSSKLAEYLTTLSFERRKQEDEILQGNPAAQDAYRSAMQLLSSLKVGDTDPWLGQTIQVIIRKSTLYIVYLDEHLDIQWWWLTRPNERAVGLVQARIGQLTKESSFLLRKGGGRLWSHNADAERVGDREMAKEIRSVMGEALALALNGARIEECDAVLAEAKRYIAVAKDERTRPWFIGFFLLVVAILGGALGVWLCVATKCCAAQIDHSFVARWLEAAVAGSSGALISAMTRTRDLGLEPAAGVKGILIEALARALIGAGSGVLVGFAYDSGLVLKDAIQDTGDVRHVLRLFLCIASGVSERILPALVGRAESLINGGDSAKPQSGSGAPNATSVPQSQGEVPDPPTQ